MAETSESTRNLFNMVRTVRSMLEKRGYTLPENSSMTSLDRFTPPAERKQLNFLAEKHNKNKDKIYVFFLDEKVGVKEIHEFKDQLVAMNNIFNAILVCDIPLTPQAKVALQAMQPKFAFEYFDSDELLFDITEHELVPLHIVLSTEEKDEILKKYSLKDSQFPRMLPTDPIARFYGLTRGQVVKILRPSEAAGRVVTYRIVM